MKRLSLLITALAYCFSAVLWAQATDVERTLKAKYPYVQYYPNKNGWYLLKHDKNGQTFYGMADSRGNIIVSQGLAYKLYDGFIEFHLVDMQKKAAHDAWKLSMKDYAVALKKYEQTEATYQAQLKAYNEKVAYAKRVAKERYDQAVAQAQSKAEAEAKSANNGSLLGNIVSGIGLITAKSIAVKSVDFDAILQKVMAEQNLLNTPPKPYNPKPNEPLEPSNGHYWKPFSFQQPCPYDEVDYKAITIKGEFADVKKNGKYGLVDAEMNQIIPCNSNAKVKKIRFSNNNLLVCVNNTYGVISPTGKQLLPCEYTEIKEVEKFLLCKKDDKWGLFTGNAKELYPCQYQDINLDRIGGKLCLFTQQKGLWGLTDFRTGKELLPSNFSKMEAFGTNDEYIKTIKDNKVGLYTGRGVLLFPCEFTNIKIITIPGLGNLFELKQGSTIGLYNQEGVEIIPIGKYTSYTPLGSYFKVSKGNQYGVCTSNGVEIIPCTYNTDIQLFAKAKVFAASKTEGATILAFDGQELFDPIADIRIIQAADDYILVQTDKKFGALNYAGKMIVPTNCSKPEQVGKKVIAYAKKNGLTQENQLPLEKINDVHMLYAQQHAQHLEAQKTFSFYAQNYVERIINDWQKKGEFEKIADWQKRVNIETRKQMVYTLTQEAQTAYIEKNQKLLPKDQLSIVGNYDPDNETFRIHTSYSDEDILVPVPMSDAQEFKTMFATLKSKPTFYVENNKLGLAEYAFYLSKDKVFTYSNEASLQYNIAQVNYDFDEISIETNTTATRKGKQTISTSTISIGRSDVDINIPQTGKQQTNTFVVIIANTHYDEAPVVQYAYNDGIIFKDYCIKTLGIPEENIQFKADATFNHMRQAVNWLREVAQNDVLTEDKKIIFYYSGHGIPDELTRSTYLLPKDGNPIDIASTGYKINDLYDMLAEVSSESVVFLDACFSGLSKSGGALASTKGVVRVNSRVPQGNSVIFSASSSNEVAHQYEEKAHGLFTYYLLKKLQETKGDVNFDQLFDYIRKEVARTSLTNAKIKKSQTPTVVAGVKASDWKVRTLL